MRKLSVFLQIILLTKISLAQMASFEGAKSTSDAFIRKIVPPSPTAASLGKYGDQQINMFTGTAAVNIPIHEIKANDISIPLSLSYSSSGLKVSEPASWVGLGWTLTGMGVITRVVKGTADFAGDKAFFSIRDFPLPLSYSNVNDGAWSYIHSYIPFHMDPEPDIYIVRAGSLNIKLMLRKNIHNKFVR